MKHGIYILTILMALLSLPESGYASIPFFAVANDTIRRAVIYFDANEANLIDLPIIAAYQQSGHKTELLGHLYGAIKQWQS